jgi:hypothetical protein
VTFTLPRGIRKKTQKAQVVGEFNEWSHSATPMKKKKNGTFIAIIELPIYREYQFRYLLDDHVWVNDSDADRFIPTPFGDSENCVLTTYNDSHIEMIKEKQLKPKSTIPDVKRPVAPIPDKPSPIEAFLSILTHQIQNIRLLSQHFERSK